MISLDDWLKNYLDGKQIPPECQGELIITMTEQTDNYWQIGISSTGNYLQMGISGASDWNFEKFFSKSNIDAYFTMLFNKYTFYGGKKYYIVIDSNVWSHLKMAKKVLLKGQIRNRIIMEVIRIDDRSLTKKTEKDGKPIVE